MKNTKEEAEELVLLIAEEWQCAIRLETVKIDITDWHYKRKCQTVYRSEKITAVTLMAPEDKSFSQSFMSPIESILQIWSDEEEVDWNIALERLTKAYLIDNAILGSETLKKVQDT